MNRQNIISLGVPVSIEQILIGQKISFNINGKLPWLQKLCFKLLHNLNAYVPVFSELFQRIEIDKGKVQECAYKCIRTVECMGHEPSTIIIGSKQFDDVSLNLNFQMRIDFTSTESQLYGYTLIVVPWIDGIVVIPKSYTKITI